MSVKEDVIYEISRLIRAKKGMLYGSVDTVKGANECRLYIQEAREISDKLANEHLDPKGSLSIDSISDSLYDIEFGYHCKAGIKIEGGKLVVVGAIDGGGNPIKLSDIKVVV